MRSSAFRSSSLQRSVSGHVNSAFLHTYHRHMVCFLTEGWNTPRKTNGKTRGTASKNPWSVTPINIGGKPIRNDMWIERESETSEGRKGVLPVEKKTLVDLQLDAQNSYLFTYNTFIKILYMFRASLCSSWGGLRRNCIYAASGIVTLCRWLSCAPVKKLLFLNRCKRQSPAESDDTRGCIYTVTT